MRKVKVYRESKVLTSSVQALQAEYEIIDEGPGSYTKIRILVGEAVFHQFGIDFQEFESGGTTYTTAVCEWPDGQLVNVPVGLVRFISPTNEKEETK